MAAMGDRSLALCGEIADGLMISNLCPLGYTERAVGILRAAAQTAGRPSPEVVQYVPCLPASDTWPEARERIVRHSGIPRAEVAEALARLRRGEAGAAVLDDRYVEAFAIAGTAEECVERAAAYRRAGVAELVLTFAGPHPEADIAYLADYLPLRHDARHGQ